MKKTRFVFIALYLIFQAISAFALDKNLVQKKLVEGHPDYYREDDILHDIGIIESKKLGKLYIYFNEHHWGNYRVTFRLIICDENKILGEYGILLMDKPWIKNNLLCFPYEEEIGNKIDFNNGIPKTVYVDGYLNNFTIYDINLNESKTVNLNVYHYAGNNPVKYTDPDGKFHFAKRNLDGAPWLGIFSNNPLDDLFNTEISHEHGFFDDGTGDNIGYFGLDGHVDWNSEDENNFQYSDSIYYDDDLMRKAIEEVGPKKNKYKLFFFGKIGPGDKKFNCQDYCDAIRKKYNELFNQLSPEEQKNILEEKKRIEDKWKKDKEKEAAFQQKLGLGL